MNRAATRRRAAASVAVGILVLVVALSVLAAPRHPVHAAAGEGDPAAPGGTPTAGQTGSARSAGPPDQPAGGSGGAGERDEPAAGSDAAGSDAAGGRDGAARGRGGGVEGTDGDAPVVRMARATWDTGWFQAEIHRQLLGRLGYQVVGPQTMTNEAFYGAAAAGEVDLWANGWFPLHRRLLPGGSPGPLQIVGTQVEGGALQGYFVDQATAREHGITGLEQLRDPAVAELFDADDDGRADLIGCNPGWGCEAVIEHHLDAYGLRETVEHVQGDYSPLMGRTVERYESGQPVLFYTWTPNWTVGQLQPGEDVRWLQAPFPDLPESQRGAESRTAVAGLSGCPDDPCRTGWPPNDIRAVANRAFLAANPPVRRLLEAVEIPLGDILAQNARMVAGEGDATDIVDHAEDWIAEHPGRVSDWITAADPDAVPAGEPGERGAGATAGAADRLRVATKPFEPLVLYEGQRYDGFAVALWDQIAAVMGVDYELYGVNTVAKQLDEVDRGAGDVALSAIGITSSREQRVDFSHPYLRTGLQVMVPSDAGAGLLGRAGQLIDAFFVSQVPLIVLLFGGALLLSAHVLWWVERRDNPRIPADYRHGIWESFWWAVVTVTTVGYGDTTPQGRVGKSVALVWMVLGYFVFAAFTATVTSSLAIGELRGDINGPADLPGNAVVTVRETPAASYLVAEGLSPMLVDEIDDAYAALDDGRAEAVVFDAPALQFHAAREGSGAVRTVGPVFDQVEYGFATAQDGALRERINRALLELVESGVYERLHNEWFGSADQAAARASSSQSSTASRLSWIHSAAAAAMSSSE